MSKVIRICFGFALLRFVIGLKILRHFPLSHAIRKAIANRLYAFYRALRLLHVLAQVLIGSLDFSTPIVISQSN